ncbi:uncharacterized protein LOC110441558 [Mizuhopecten yessoensis]|uniref:DNA polymerase iota n=1 Tax=Mizuhopecten yessoensis TaxID=6573 RepID=A0A210R1E5_MIZYE|nr:uncharacterized protein LOC110441558 [Mizuhopecten yessoensis]OWF54711.1 DNA polymerase iota [Mizuhopecten yessoensis]
MDEHGMEFEDNEDESWSLPFNGDSSPSNTSIDIGCQGSACMTDTQDRRNRKQQHRLSSNSADSCMISTLGHTRTIIHIDIDCFYAQVEMMRNPKLRDKPLGVQQKYLVVTCNYVAREYGVTKLMGVKEALDRCPNLVLVSGEDLTHYRQVSYKISEFLQQYTPHVERLGMDENFLDVSHLAKQRLESGDTRSDVIGHEYKFENEDSIVREDKCGKDRLATCTCGCHERLTVGSQIAADIRDALHQEINITCCAGISYNKLLSKLVAGKHKPNQQTTLFPEQTAQFMATVGQVRRIPGIGSTTSKKLAALGIVLLQDLQQFDISDLKQELEPKQAVVIQQLSFGVDDSPVVTFGRPQTISDEDSFKKCSTVKDVRSKVKEFLCSLIKRLLDDGRTPQTLRLTIRKLTTADKKWTSRESRQCPIPGHIMSCLSSGKLERLTDQLEEIAMTLFTKLVDTKEPFHLTLMNIAFCSLVEKSKNAISSFFTVRSPRHGVDHGHPPGDSHVGQKSVPTPDRGKQQNSLQKWVIKSPEKLINNSPEDFPDNCEARSTNVSRSPQGCLVVPGHSGMSPGIGDARKNDNGESRKIVESVKKDSSELKTLSCQKRKAEEAIEDKHSRNKKTSLGRNIRWSSSARSPEEIACSYTGRKCSEARLSIPKDVDMEIFLQLPRDIQREILQEEESRKGQMYSTQTEKSSGYEELNSVNDTDNNCSTSHVRSDYPEGRGGQRKDSRTILHTASVKESSSPSDCGGIEPTGDRSEDFPFKQSMSTRLPSDNKLHTHTGSGQPSMSERPTKTVSVVNTTKKQSGDILNLKLNSVDDNVTGVCEETRGGDSHIDDCDSNHSANQTYQIPPHVDKEVFSNLPSDIQMEYLCQWSRVPKMSPESQGALPDKKQISTAVSQGRLPNTKHKPNAGKTSILQFFQSKNKK